MPNEAKAERIERKTQVGILAKAKKVKVTAEEKSSLNWQK